MVRTGRIVVQKISASHNATRKSQAGNIFLGAQKNGPKYPDSVVNIDSQYLPTIYYIRYTSRQKNKDFFYLNK